MEADTIPPATHAGHSSIISKLLFSSANSTCCEHAASSFIPFKQQGTDMKLYITRLYNHKQLAPLTLQYFTDEIEGFQHLSTKLGLTPQALLKKAVDAGMPLVVASMEAKNKDTKPNTNKG